MLDGKHEGVDLLDGLGRNNFCDDRWLQLLDLMYSTGRLLADDENQIGSDEVTDLLAWAKQRSWDWAKVGALLYGLGILITSIYFLRFSVLSLDLLRPHSVLVGSYFVALYLLLPAAFLVVLKPLKRNSAVLVAFSMLLMAKEVVLGWLIGGPPATAVVLLVMAQLALFVRFSVEGKAAFLRFEVVPKDVLAGLAFAVLLFLFASTSYGCIPGYLGGGKPILVHVFTETADLPDSRFMQTKNMPQINMALTSFRLRLLYESEDYFYFVAESQGIMKGYSVMRLKRDQVLRMDYITPVWFGGEQ